jgi:hypothetical protein
MKILLTLARLCFITLLLALSGQLSYGNSPVTDATPCGDSLEITDLSNQVILGINKKSVYMYFSEDLRTYLNWTYEEEYLRDLNSFMDSNGEFVPVPAIYIHESKIEYDINDIQRIVIRNGVIGFTYHNRLAVSFEDILLPGGSVLSNFSEDDVEKFIEFFDHKVK